MTDDLISRAAALECCNEMIRKSKPLEKSTSAIELRRAIAALPAAQVQAELVTGTPITMTYRNHRGEVNLRRILPTRIWFGSTDWHPEPVWIMSAYDLAKAEHRDFALADCQFANLSTAPTKSPDDLDSLVQRLRAPAYWMSGSYAEHEGENNAPREAATAITTLRNKLALANIDAEYLAEALAHAQYWMEGSPDRHEPVVARAREAIEAHNKRLEVENDHRNDA